MNRKSVFYTLGLILDIEAVLMLAPAFVSCFYREWNSALMLLLSSLITAAAGSLLLFVSAAKGTGRYTQKKVSSSFRLAGWQ